MTTNNSNQNPATQVSETSENVFELSLRVLGVEFFGMKLSSESKYKNWALFGLIVMVLLLLLVNEIGPGLVDLIQAVNS